MFPFDDVIMGSGTRALLESLRNANVHEFLDDNPYAKPNINYNKLHSCIIELKEKHLSYKLIKFNKYENKGNKLITNGIIKSLKFRDKLYKEMKSLEPNSSSYFKTTQNLSADSQSLKKKQKNENLKLCITIMNSTKSIQYAQHVEYHIGNYSQTKGTIVLA